MDKTTLLCTVVGLLKPWRGSVTFDGRDVTRVSPHAEATQGVMLVPEGPCYYPEEQVTDQQERFIAAELIREAVLRHTHQEIPYAVAVMVEEFKERGPGMTYISATIFVEKDSQKGIVIGQGGGRC